jgi:hypothetical protein
MKITVKELRQIIKEELISIKRGNRTIFYDAEIDNDDNIVNVVKKDLSADLSRVLEVAANYTSASPAKIINAVSAYKDAGGKIFKTATSIEAIQEDMKEWLKLDVLSWAPKNTKGRGEAAVHIAFAAKEGVREPDFVSADGSIKISIKYAGEGDTSVRSADTASKELSSALENFRRNLSDLSGENFEFPSNNFTPKNFGQVLATILRNKKNFGVNVIDILTTLIKEIKQALITEHGAESLLVFTNGGVSIIDSNNIDNIHLRYIKNGNRVEYFCTPVSSQDSYDNVLTNFSEGNKEPVNYRSLARKNTSKEAELEKTAKSSPS